MHIILLRYDVFNSLVSIYVEYRHCVIRFSTHTLTQEQGGDEQFRRGAKKLIQLKVMMFLYTVYIYIYIYIYFSFTTVIINITSNANSQI